MSSKPPLGIIPKNLHEEKRLDKLRRAIQRYFDAELKLPVEWVMEYNELTDKVYNRRLKDDHS